MVVVGGGDTAMEDALVLARTSKRVTVVHRAASFNKASHVLASKVKGSATVDPFCERSRQQARDVNRAFKHSLPSTYLLFNLPTQLSILNKVLAHEKIDVIWFGKVEKFEGIAPSPSAVEINADGEVSPQQQRGGSGLEMVRVRITNSHGTVVRVPCKAAFVAIGHDPINHFLDQLGVDKDAGGYLVTAEGGGVGGEGVGSTMTSVPGLFAAGDAADAVYRQVLIFGVVMFGAHFVVAFGWILTHSFYSSQ